MNKKRGLLLAVFLLALAMVVGVEGGSVCGTWQPNNRCGGGSQLGQTTVSTQSLCKFFCEGFSDTTCCSFTEGEFENTCRATKATGFTSGSSSQSAMLCDPIDDDDEEAYDPEFCNPFSSTRQCSPDDVFDPSNDVLIDEEVTTQNDCLELCDLEDEVTCCHFIPDLDNLCQGFRNIHKISNFQFSDATICLRDANSTNEACNIVNGNWSDDCGCCYEDNEFEFCDVTDETCLRNESNSFEWMEWGEYVCEETGGVFGTYDDYVFPTYNVYDNCCGNDPFRCVPVNDAEGCENHLDRKSCQDAQGCTWQESDLGGILNLAHGPHLCLPVDNKLPTFEDWNFIYIVGQEDENEHQRETIEIENGQQKLVYEFVGATIPDPLDNIWYTCDAFNTNYLTSADGGDHVLGMFQKPSYVLATNTVYLNNYICYGHSFLTTGSSQNVVNVRSLFAECNNQNKNEALHTIKKSHFDGTGQRIRIDLSENGYDHLHGFRELSFFMKLTNLGQMLTEVRFYDENEQEISRLPIYKTQDTNVMNWTRYIVKLNTIPDNQLKQVKSFYIYFTPYTNNVQISNISLAYNFAGVREFYCNDDRYWFEDLDKEHGESVCEALPSFGWTGNYCCGDDTKFGKYELYSDTLGGCYKGIPVMNDTLVYNQSGNELHKRFLYLDEQFIGCDMGLSYDSSNKRNSTGGNFNPTKLSEEQANLCDVYGSYVCGFSNIWKHEDDEIYNGVNTSHNFSLSMSPNQESAQCCPGNTCWEGTHCVNETTYLNGLVCLQGEWVDEVSSRKYEPYRKYFGHCAPSQCYINITPEGLDLDGDEDIWDKYDNKDNCLFTPYYYLVQGSPFEGCFDDDFDILTGPLDYYSKISGLDGNNINGACVPSHYYVDDDYCLNGTWTTRQQLIASVFIDYANNSDIENFSILCDEQEIALNKSFSHLPPTGDDNHLALGENHVCVMSYYTDEGEERLLGVSGNIPNILNNLTGSKEFCNNLFTNEDFCSDGECDYNQFKFCGKDDDISIYINPHMNSVIIQRYHYVGTNPFTFWQQLINLILNPINAIIDFIRGPEKPINFGFAGTKMFSDDVSHKFYLNKQNDKEIFGYVRDYFIQEGSNDVNYIFTDYKNLNENICSMIYPLELRLTNFDLKLLCEPYYINSTEWGFMVKTERRVQEFDKLIGKGLFNDLTSELRLSKEPSSKPDFIYLRFNQTPMAGVPFSIEVKNQLDNQVSIDDFKFESRKHTTQWSPHSGCLDYYNEINCNLNDKDSEYRIEVESGNLKVIQKFTLSEPISFECEIVPNTDCFWNSKTRVLKLSDTFNAFVAEPDYAGYPYSLCCEFKGVEFEPEIKEVYEDEGYLLSLQLQEKQGKVTQNSGYGNSHLYLKSDNAVMDCSFETDNCSEDYEGILSLSNYEQEGESQVVAEYDYEHYSNKLCCKIN